MAINLTSLRDTETDWSFDRTSDLDGVSAVFYADLSTDDGGAEIEFEFIITEDRDDDIVQAQVYLLAQEETVTFWMMTYDLPREGLNNDAVDTALQDFRKFMKVLAKRI